MELQIQIRMNPALFIRDPEQTELGRNIIRQSIRMIDELGFEDFTFKKLAAEMGTTEASIYRYFENKHRLLTYIVTWFWAWMEYQVIFYTNNQKDAKTKINTIISLLTFRLQDEISFTHIDKQQLFRITIAEGTKSYLTKHVTEDNKARLFKPYKDLCARIADVFLEHSPSYPYPRSLSSTLLEMAHWQYYFKENLPSLTDFAKDKTLDSLVDFLTHLVFSSLESRKLPGKAAK